MPTRHRPTARSCHRRPRRGVTLVVVAICLTVFLGFAALAIDVARLTNFKGELKGIADAAAMSAALDLAGGASLATATANVNTLVGNNPIEGNARVAAGNITISPIAWSFATPPASGSEVVLTSANWNTADAVRVIASYSMNWTLARIFGQGTGRTLVDTSIAAYGGRRTHDCLRPIVLPYSALRTVLSLTPTDTTSLTAANIYALRAITNPVTYTVLDTVNPANASSFGWVHTRQGTTATATNVAAAVESCLSGTLGAGSTLTAVPKAGDSTTVQSAVTSLCGSATTCSLTPRLLVPLYVSGTNTGTGGTTTTQTNQTYDFTLTAVSNGCLNGLNATGSNFFTLSQCSTDVSRVPTVPATFTSGNTTTTCTGTRAVLSYSRSARTVTIRFATCTVSTTTGGTGRAASTYEIKYIAPFVLTARTNTTITGYFTTVNYPPAAAGSWAGTPGPVTSAVLVR